MHLAPEVRDPAEWTEEEDLALRDLVEQCRGMSTIPWSRIVKMLPGRMAAYSQKFPHIKGRCSRAQEQPREITRRSRELWSAPARPGLPFMPERRAQERG